MMQSPGIYKYFHFTHVKEWFRAFKMKLLNTGDDVCIFLHILSIYRKHNHLDVGFSRSHQLK